MKKLGIILIVFLLTGLCVFVVGSFAEPSTGVSPITQSSPCPATSCASGRCHGFGDVPQPDGVHSMTCPKAGCESASCHAWETLSTRYHQASDASLNLWVLAPALLVVVLMLVIGKTR